VTAFSTNRTLHFNNLLDACVTGFFLAMVGCIALISLWTWWNYLAGRKKAVLYESECILLPEYAVAETRPANIAGTVGLALALAKELSGESHIERAKIAQEQCGCSTGTINLLDAQSASCKKTDAELYVEMTERRFDGVKRCC
jgi:hypothetical protein